VVRVHPSRPRAIKFNYLIVAGREVAQLGEQLAIKTLIQIIHLLKFLKKIIKIYLQFKKFIV
jgi:hypothetical protein